MQIEPSHKARQCAIIVNWLGLPVLKVRIAVPSQYGGWEWSRWRKAKSSEILLINAFLIKLWKN
jgi:hypothetical protein